MSRLKNIRHEKFCQLFVWGNPKHDPTAEDPEHPDTLHNATKSYELAGYKARGNSAAVCGSKLLRRPDVQERIVELRDEAVLAARTRHFRWDQLYGQAQEILRRALAGEEVSASAVTAAKEVVNRKEGPLNFRFRDPKTGEDTQGIPIYVFGGGDDEA